jgi:signal transduction histidine kinase
LTRIVVQNSDSSKKTRSPARSFGDVVRAAGASIRKAARSDTERRAAEELVRRLEQSVGEGPTQEATGAFLSAACHDLKDPLAAIVMGAGYLLRTLPEDPAMRRVAEAIQRSALRAGQLVQDLHEVARLESNRIETDPRKHEVLDLVAGAVEAFAEPARLKEIRIEQGDIPRDLRVLCDKEQLLRALGKILDNAIKFSETGGKVTVTGERQEAQARISVTDAGRGIAQDRLHSIFDREANARQRPRDGPGLGLTIARGLIELQHGKIGVLSEVGRGSTFFFTLPLA